MPMVYSIPPVRCMQQGRAFYYDGTNLSSAEAHNLGLSTPRKVAQSLKHQPL